MPRGRACDVAIVGAGSIGLPAAYAMARSGLRVMVFDAAASPGQGSHKAAIGGIRATHSDPVKIRLCQRTLAVISSWEEACGESLDWEGGGYSFVAYRDQEERILRSLLETQRAAGLNIRWYDADALRQIIPALNAERLRGGTFSPEDGHCSTLLAGHAFYRHARRAGAAFRFGEPVTGVVVRRGRVRAVRTSQGRFPAAVVLNAAGAWASDIGRLVGEEHPVRPHAHEAGITEPVAPFLGPMIVDIRPGPSSGNCYFYQLRSGQVGFSLTPRPAVERLDRRETSTFLPAVAKRILQVVPRLEALRVRRTWRGIYPMTPDGSPLVGWSRSVRGYFAAIGMCGQGFMLGPGLGELLARVVADEATTPEDAEALRALSPYRTFGTAEKLK